MKVHIAMVVLAAAVCPAAMAQRLGDLATPAPMPAGSFLVVGFLGGFERWDDGHRSVRQLALRLRSIPGVYAESFSNHRRGLALQFIARALDQNRNRKLDAGERTGARIILFGQSWGGAAVIKTARDLERMGIPVLLTVQVDSVGAGDATVPRNVRAAVNFYQHDPLTIQGRREIRAADPARTEILGNFGYTYLGRSIDESNASLPRRVLGGGHAKMELDPEVWSRVETYIRNSIDRR